MSSSKEKGSSSSSSKEKSRSSSSSSSSYRPRTADELREKEYMVFLESCLSSHGGYLKSPILSLSTSLAVSPLTTSYALAGIYLIILLFTPAFLLPHISALITLIIPIQASRQSIALEQSHEKNKDGKKAEDSVQWCLYWVIWCCFELVRGWIGVWRPGYKAIFEIIRTAGLITVGGPWFGRAGLVSKLHPSCSIYHVRYKWIVLMQVRS